MRVIVRFDSLHWCRGAVATFQGRCLATMLSNRSKLAVMIRMIGKVGITDGKGGSGSHLGMATANGLELTDRIIRQRTRGRELGAGARPPTLPVRVLEEASRASKQKKPLLENGGKRLWVGLGVNHSIKALNGQSRKGGSVQPKSFVAGGASRAMPLRGMVPV